MPLLDRPLVEVENRGHVGEIQILQVVQDQNLAIRRRQALKGDPSPTMALPAKKGRA